MKALLSKQCGGPETLVLEDVPDPVPGAGQVRVAVRACGVNFPDLLMIQDLYQYKPPRPFSPGAEVAGVIDAVGEGVGHLRAGDRVILSPARGGMAQKTVGLAGNCWKIPDGMPFDEAAAAGAPVVFFCAAPGLYGRRLDRAGWQSGFDWWAGAAFGDASRHARRLGLWIALSTQAGATADEDFPGLAALVDPTGAVVCALPDWREGTLLVDIPTSPRVRPLPTRF